jgi:hypothetical protein
MGIREVRFCDITGSETDVEPHELHIDALRVEIDLADAEYRKLLEMLRPYMDAGRLEASAPEAASLPTLAQRRRNGHASTRPKLDAAQRQQLREWAETQGIPIPANNRFKASLIDRWKHETTVGP